MIVRLQGILLDKAPARIVLDVQGVGYAVHITLATYDHLPALETLCTLQIYHHIREDDQTLFGFRNSEEKHLFEQLITVTGIGPKLAMTILGGLPIQDLTRAISSGDVRRMQTISGVGKKTAERIIMELREKIDPFAGLTVGSAPAQSTILQDTVLALVSLGFAQEQAQKMTQAASAANPGLTDTNQLLKAALGHK